MCVSGFRPYLDVCPDPKTFYCELWAKCCQICGKKNAGKCIEKCSFYIKYFDKIKYYADRPYLVFFQSWNLKHTYIFIWPYEHYNWPCQSSRTASVVVSILAFYAIDPGSIPARGNLHFLVLWDCRIQHLFGNRVALNPGLSGVRDVASTIISQYLSMNRLSKTESAIFKLWMMCFQRISSDYLELTTAVVVPCGGPKMFPRTSI